MRPGTGDSGAAGSARRADTFWKPPPLFRGGGAGGGGGGGFGTGLVAGSKLKGMKPALKKNRLVPSTFTQL